MGWEIVIPEATTNLVSNPSIEKATTGYTASNASLAQVVTDRAVGVGCLEVTPTSNTTGGVYYAVTLSTTTTYTFSVSVKGEDGIPYKIVIYDQTAGIALGTTTFIGDGTWRRYSVTVTTGANTNIRLFVQKNSSSSTAAFYVDAMQLEEKDHPTTYCDGNQPGCEWVAGEHTSTSTRSAQSAEGGRVRDLASHFGFDVRSSVGVGMPPLDLIESDPALSDGTDHQRSIARARTFQLVGTISGDDRDDYHAERQTLINALNPHRLSTDEQVRLRYYQGDNRVEIAARYAGGLEKVAQETPAVEVIGLRLRAQEDPFFVTVAGITGGQYGQLNDALGLSVRSSSTINYIVQRKTDGNWDTLGGGMNDAVTALAVGPDGTLYAGGSFTTAGGSSANYIAAWDGSSWSALGSGMNNIVRAIVIAQDGSLYAGGHFTTAGGSDVNYIAAWGGSSWSALGSGMDDNVWDLVFGPDGTLYAGGYFTTAGGSSANYIAAWDGSSWSALGSGMNNEVLALAIGPDGVLYAGGGFTTAGGETTTLIAKWNGSMWSGLGLGIGDASQAGTTDFVREIGVDKYGTVYAGGFFSTAGGITIPNGIAQWSGSVWTAISVELPSPGNVYAIASLAGSLILGFDTGGSGVTAGVNSVTNNGSANAYPVVRMSGPGRIASLENFTTGKTIYFDLDLENGETVTLDLRSGKKTLTSTFRGSIEYTILAGSDVSDFYLAPGDNDISILIDDASAETTMEWLERHWSFDGVAA